MLTALRHAAGTWVAKLLLILLVLSFAVWGISGQIMGGAGTNVVTAGGTGVTAMDYRLAYDRQISVLSQQFGTRLTREQAQQFGVDNQVLSQLVAGAVLDEQASKMRLGLSRDRLAQLTAEDPAFRGAGGGFNRQQFDFVLRQVGMTPDEYLRNREQVAIRQQIIEAVSEDVAVPQAFLQALALYQGETRTVEFVAVPRDTITDVPAPTEEELASHFEANKASYAAPEYRRVSYILLQPEDIADEAAVTDQMVQEAYEAARERYTQAERRTIDQLVFASEDEARQARQRITDGDSFEDVVASQNRSLSDVRLGSFARDAVADTNVAEAAFALDEGGVSDVVAGNFGPILVRVSEIVPETVRPLPEVAAEIRRELAVDEATRVIHDVHDTYEDARAGGETMQEAAARLDLTMQTIEQVDARGRGPDGAEIDGIPERDRILADAFETEVGIENPSINIGSVGFLYYEVDEILPARDRTLDEVRDRVAADWTERETRARLAEIAADMKAALDQGTPFEQVAAGRTLEVRTKRGVSRSTNDGDLGSAGVAAVFSVQQNGTGVVSAPDGTGQIVFRVVESVTPMNVDPSSLPPQTVDTLASGLADDILDQLVSRLQTEYEVTVNRGAINQALSF